jgi:ABC-type transport system involved in cytochrome bd biosynthesis fused ATPase/permease subunit
MNQDLSLVGWPLAVTILSFLVVVCVIVVFAIIYRSKRKMLQAQQIHEIAVMDKKFEQKMQIEELLKPKRDEEWIREKDEIKKRLDNLWSKRNDVTPLDMKRVTLLHLILSGKNNNITAENLDEEAKKINKIYEMVKECVKD